jgi:hypothetical protein
LITSGESIERSTANSCRQRAISSGAGCGLSRYFSTTRAPSAAIAVATTVSPAA